MSHKVSYNGNGSFWLNNSGFNHLLDTLFERAERMATTRAEREDVALFKAMDADGHFWSGRCFDLRKDDLSELSLPRFWSDQLMGLAEDVLSHRVGSDWPMNRRLSVVACGYQWSYFFRLKADALGRSET